ncbi:hypothetical protein PRMUPPPA20_29060 [Xylanibacter ruminicola]|uniref:Lipoprotein n=1 Tax=Xylanibacter ruminicola TaxID=839 RepID=A0AA37I5D5_XYLRU|nr:hypothetical protein [Xylanibacter ruminicola]GJG34797.1 hypothetical protein PRMUPPPA20_29060 [Xylanibacter ruminicola]SEH88097.1 hypothetical protein SAMN02745192_2038 [Xylanibacter ruminicola]
MNIKMFKLKAINKMLTLLGFSSVAFVFTACYGTKPCDYREEMADSLSVAFRNAESDSIGVNQQPAVSASDGTAEVRR